MYFRTVEMKCIGKYIIATVLCMSAWACLHAQQVLVKGYVMSIDSSRIVPLANIQNKTSGQRFIGARSGLFKASFSPDDSIQITAIGYETLYFIAKDIIPEKQEDTIQLFMRPKAYQLKDVTIVYSNRRQDSLAQLAAEFLKNDPLMNNYDRVVKANEGGMMSPLTAIYMEYSKEGMDRKRFMEFMRHAEMLKQVDRRYNKKTIKRATGLEEEYLDAYILYCKLDRAFILSSSDYDLILAMRQCADRFRAEKGIH
ncbi:MAG: hypothetical protein V4590_11375 [Bacteroidota bacterium]